MKKFGVILLLVTLLFQCAHAWEGSVRIPERPPDKDLWDAAQLLDGENRERVLELQALCSSQYQAPLAVVTIHRASDYIKNNPTIEHLASMWFDKWALGTAEENYGILLIVSLEDRQARIELGAGWRGMWDLECHHIMQTVLVPNFKKGVYGYGIVKGCEELASMAEERVKPYSAKGLAATQRRLGYWVEENASVMTMLPSFRWASPSWGLGWGYCFSGRLDRQAHA